MKSILLVILLSISNGIASESFDWLDPNISRAAKSISAPLITLQESLAHAFWYGQQGGEMYSMSDSEAPRFAQIPSYRHQTTASLERESHIPEILSLENLQNLHIIFGQNLRSTSYRPHINGCIIFKLNDILLNWPPLDYLANRCELDDRKFLVKSMLHLAIQAQAAYDSSSTTETFKRLSYELMTQVSMPLNKKILLDRWYKLVAAHF